MRDVRLAALADAPDAFAATLASEPASRKPSGAPGSAPGPGSWAASRTASRAGLIAAAAAAAAGPGPGRAAWHLVSMWVSPQARGSGLADRLVGAVTEHARPAARPG